MWQSAQLFGKNRGWLCLMALLGAISIRFVADHAQLYWTTEDLIASYGYTAETHTVATPDGYLLDIHRIRRNSTGPPVLFQHGFLCSSAIWVFQGPKRDLAFLLADEGYDVWLLNGRGSSYTRLNATAAKTRYNDFSFQEMGLLDLPAVVDYVLATTARKNVTLIGHSMGTTLTFAALSVHDHLNHKVNMFVAIAPFLYPEPFTNPWHQMYEILFVTMKNLQLGELVDYTGFFRKHLWTKLLAMMPIMFLDPAFKFYLSEISGNESKRKIHIPADLILTHFPDTIAFKTLQHYHENLKNGRFLMRDFGATTNQKLYNSTQPPEFDLSRIRVPISVIVSDADEITPAKVFLKHVPKFHTNISIRSLTDFHHFDLIWSRDAVSAVYPHIMQDIQSAIRLFH